MVSKYIGATEKNLSKIFGAAEGGAILLLDEADALFGALERHPGQQVRSGPGGAGRGLP